MKVPRRELLFSSLFLPSLPAPFRLRLRLRFQLQLQLRAFAEKPFLLGIYPVKKLNSADPGISMDDGAAVTYPNGLYLAVMDLGKPRGMYISADARPVSGSAPEAEAETAGGIR